MEEPELGRFKMRLEALRDDLLDEGDVSLASTAKDGGEGKVDDDAAPLSEMNQVIASSRNRERAQRLGAIREALELIEEDPDLFGHCETCEEEIPPRRLKLMPWARFCLQCQSKAEDGGRGGSRKNLRDFK